MPDGSTRLVEPVEKEVPVVEPVQSSEGYLMLPRPVDRKTIAN
jgi:hypothetical protein